MFDIVKLTELIIEYLEWKSISLLQLMTRMWSCKETVQKVGENNMLEIRKLQFEFAMTK